MKRFTTAVRARRLAIVPGGSGKEQEGQTRTRRQLEEEKQMYDAVDEVLDKISAKGMASLTPAELKLLDEVSRKKRAN